MTGTGVSEAEQLGKQEAKSLAARDRICRAVADCLTEHGYADTSINRVVELAGVSKGALQHHFRSKEDLMAAMSSPEGQKLSAALLEDEGNFIDHSKSSAFIVREVEL